MVARAASGTLGGVSMKHLSLVTVRISLCPCSVYARKLMLSQLTFQNSALILVRLPFMANDDPRASKKRTHDANCVYEGPERVSG